MQGKVADRDETIKQLEKEVRLRDSEINDQRGEIAARDQTIAQL